MKYLLLVSAIASLLAVQQAAAKNHVPARPAQSTAQRIEAVIHGEGKPGDVVVSRSDPAISYRVLDNGLIKRTDKRYGTSEVRGPIRRWYKNHDHAR